MSPLIMLHLIERSPTTGPWVQSTFGNLFSPLHFRRGPLDVILHSLNGLLLSQHPGCLGPTSFSITDILGPWLVVWAVSLSTGSYHSQSDSPDINTWHSGLSDSVTRWAPNSKQCSTSTILDSRLALKLFGERQLSQVRLNFSATHTSSSFKRALVQSSIAFLHLPACMGRSLGFGLRPYYMRPIQARFLAPTLHLNLAYIESVTRRFILQRHITLNGL